MHTHSELPTVRAVVRLEGAGLDRTEWYDVKFYPHTTPGDDPVFAAVGGRYTVICRCILHPTSAYEVLRVFEDERVKNTENLDLNHNSVEWSQAPNGDPLVCVTGNLSRIQVLNVVTGECVTSLVGHGGGINDLAVSPIDPTVLASSSLDHSVRIWSLDPAHEKQPTAAICYGQGHQDQVLSLGFHRKGKCILSAGMDTRVNLWMVPDDLKSYAGTDEPAMIHYPHFSTSEIHNDYVDCIKWYNDLILSHAARESTILLWRIDDFNSDRPLPKAAPIPLSARSTSHTKVTIPASTIGGTRSAWGGRFQRLLQFDLPDHDIFYNRFSLFHELGAHPVLVAGNERSKLFFWDLQRLEDLGTGDGDATMHVSNEPKTQKGLPRHIREESSVSSASVSTTTHSTGSASTRGRGGARAARSSSSRGIGDPFHSVPLLHDVVAVKGYNVAFRQFAWSNDGQWCIGVGNNSIMVLLHRWEHGVPPPVRMDRGEVAE